MVWNIAAGIPKILPSPDDALPSALQFLGIRNALVLALVLLGLSLKAWTDLIRSTYERGRKLGGRVSVGSVWQLGAGGILVASGASLQVVLGQLASLLSTFVAGNYISALFHYGPNPDVRLDSIEKALVQSGILGIFTPVVFRGLVLDNLSLALMTLAMGGYIASYFGARKKGTGGGFINGLLGALPFSPGVPIALVFVLINVTGGGLNDDGQHALFAFAVCAIYTATVVIATCGSWVSMLAWSTYTEIASNTRRSAL